MSKTATLIQDDFRLDPDNKEWQDALQIVDFTRRSLFLTGKAGTGKSTFLRYVAKHTKKKHVILAPTGIAAINVGGATLHSFFRLPFHPLLPNDRRYDRRHIKDTLKYSGDHRKLLRQIELIIIDEISMVRADIIDFIDKVLRIYTRSDEPFGGKQLLLVGDVFQLEPVVKEEERQMLQPFYASPYFFCARVWSEMQLVSVELKKVYRQSNRDFISMLDRIRQNQALASDIDSLNSRVSLPIAFKDENELQITLATRRDTVDYINEQHLQELPGDKTTFEGFIEGDFPLSSLPTPMQLEMKPGAQVIFIRNDKEKRWVNGTLGIVVGIDVAPQDGNRSSDRTSDMIITVRDEQGREYDVEQEVWENVRYTFNEKEQRVEESLLGTYTQFPLRLAWAITVHKSQGLTFNHVNIDFTGGAFAGGQTYVALSRCRSLEGITLAAPLRRQDIFVRHEVVAFAKMFNNDAVVRQAIEEGEADRLYRDAVRAFDRGDYRSFLADFFRAIHCRYDIEKPTIQRFILRKLQSINSLRSRISQLEEENKALRDSRRETQEMLKRLAAEYVLMGKECEREHVRDAAVRNYEKALQLCPDFNEAKRRLKKLSNAY